MIEIDGAYGEGGGQILRTALSLSAATGAPFTITGIRAGRRRPGLMRQHLAAVLAAARISRAETSGAEPGATRLRFRPREVRSGRYRFAVGSAGSAALVFQTVLPPLLTARGESHLVVEGGTHNPFAPPFDFIDLAFLPLIRRMGPLVTASLERPGFFPAGGGRFTAMLRPAESLSPIHLCARGRVTACRARAVVARLPRHIAEREIAVIRRELSLPDAHLSIEDVQHAAGPGNVVTLAVESESLTEVFSGFGRRGVPAETVALEAVREAREYMDAGVPVGRRLADQLLVPLALSGGGSFRTLAPSRHTRTNARVIRQFLDVDIRMSESDDGSWEIAISAPARPPGAPAPA